MMNSNGCDPSSAFFDHSEPFIATTPIEARGRRFRRSQGGGRPLDCFGSPAHDDGPIDSLLFPAFAWSPGPRQWNSRLKNPLFFMILLKVQPLACRRDDGELAGNPDWLGRERIRA